jgi:purine-cytosine permease-like protein
LTIIERFGLDSVPALLRTSRWYDYFILQFAFSFNAGNFLLPSLAVLEGHLSFYGAVFSIVLGNFAAYLIVSVFALPGVDYGIPGQYAIRSVLGSAGSRFISSPLRVLISIYWFAVQSLGAAVVIHSMLIGFGISFINVISIAIVFAVFMTFIAIMGFHAVTRIIRLMMPLLLLIMVVMWVLFLTSDSPHFQWSYVSTFQGENQWLVFLFFSSLSFSQFIGNVSSSADICRYAKTRKDAFFGLLTGNTLGLIVTASLAAYAAIAMGEWNPYVAATQLSHSYLIQLLILAGVMISMFSINLNNAYTGGFSLLNAIPKLNRISATAFIGIAAMGLCLFPSIIGNAEIFISFLGSLAAPLGGVIIIDYLWIKKMKIDTAALQQSYGIYHYFHGYNIPAAVSIIVGFIYFHTAPNELSLGLTSCLLSGALYFISSFIQTQKLNKGITQWKDV